LETAPVTAAKYTLAAMPVAPVVTAPGVHTLNVAVGAGDGNPAATRYSLQVTPAVGANNWVQAGGALGATPVFRTSTAWGTTTILGLAEFTPYLISAVACNEEGLNTAQGSAAIGTTLDQTPPTGTVHISTGAVHTNSTLVPITLSADDGLGSGVASMQFSNDGTTWSGWEPFGTSKTWTVASGDGGKTIFVQFSDVAGNVSIDPIRIDIVLDTTPPTASITLDDPTPTDADVVHLSVVFSESVGSTFTAEDIVVTGTLAGTALVSGSDPNYTVTVTLSDPDADGTVGINVGTGVNDAAGNACAGASSPLYTIANWHGFAAEPQDARMYTGDAHTFEVQIVPGPLTPAYQWKWEDGSKAVQDGPAAPTWMLTGLGAGHRGLYWCEVTYGGVTYPSQQATLLVEDHLQITPLADQTLQAGASCMFAVTASGGYAPITYTWRKDSITIDTATGPSYTRADLTGEDSGTYAVEVLDGNGDVQTASATLTVLEGLPVAGLAGAACLLGLIGLFGATRMKRR
jgi:hypothetical protein